MQHDRFVAHHVVLSGHFSLPVPPEKAFVFFTPEGERDWIPDWAPEYLHPLEGTLQEGLVFRTDVGGEQTLWLVVRYDSVALEAEYVRVVPDSRLGTVVVRCRGGTDGDTDVEVTYSLTGLSDAGNQVLAAVTEGTHTPA